MPKEKKDRSVSSDRSMASPLLNSSSRSKHPSSETGLESEDNVKEWEDARCPVCMEHPHNAILLLCSSHDKGCRPFMCDTSYRHSNCFDLFKKSFTKDPKIPEQGTVSDALLSVIPIRNTSGRRNEEGSSSMNPILLEAEAMPILICPLCRGEINGCITVDSARRFMDAKARSCANEACEFSGTYSDLQKHARTVHPLVRPTVPDPERQRNWTRMENERNFGDLLSSLHPPIVPENNVQTTDYSDDGDYLTAMLLVRVLQSGSSGDRPVISRTGLPVGTVARRLLTESGEELHQNQLPTFQSSGSSRRRSRRQRGESPDEEGEVHEYSSDGGPEGGRGLRRSRRNRTSPEN